MLYCKSCQCDNKRDPALCLNWWLLNLVPGVLLLFYDTLYLNNERFFNEPQFSNSISDYFMVPLFLSSGLANFLLPPCGLEISCLSFPESLNARLIFQSTVLKHPLPHFETGWADALSPLK